MINKTLQNISQNLRAILHMESVQCLSTGPLLTLAVFGAEMQKEARGLYP